MDKPFSNHYCPCCLRPVNPVTGDHWDYCEYEARVGDWTNPNKPLTKIEMLEKKLLLTKEELKNNRKYERELKSKIITINKAINEG